MTKFWTVAGIVGFVAYFLIPVNMSFAWMFLSYASAVIIGTCLGFYYVLSKGTPYNTCPQPKKVGNLLKMLMDRASQQTASTRKLSTVISRSVDNSIDELLDLIIRDYIMYYLRDITHDHEKLQELIKGDCWIVVKNIKEVLGKIDEVKFLTNDVTNKLCQHYQKIRISSLGDSREQKPVFFLRPYLQTHETEIEFLRKVSEAFLVLLLPMSYSRCEPIRHLLREILTCSVLYPTIKMLCDPDYINQQLLNYILYHQEMMEHHKKTYAYAATYEDFIKMISDSTDVNHLKQMRYKIMSEIMQATTINNLKKAKGMDVDKEFNPLSGHKGDLLQARNLERYINQLTIAKNRCEQKMKILGGPDYLSPSSPTSADINEELSPNIPGRKVLSYQVVMESPHARHFFMKFLEKENAHAFLGFWESVETMKIEDKKNLHNIGNDVYKTYVANTNSPIKLEKNIVKGMELFLIGDKGPEAFFTAQEIISRHLEERHYPCFIVSDWYHKMLKGADEQGIDFMTISTEQVEDGNGNSNEASIESGPFSSILLSDQTSYAREKMQQLEERLNNKTQAFQALKGSQNSDAKVVSKLQKKIEAIKEEKNRLASHIYRTDLWSENLGKWKIHIANAKVIYDKDKPCPSFNLNVYQKGKDFRSSNEEDGSGWSIAKKLSDFMALHGKLIQIGPWLKYTELPKGGKTLFKNYDEPFLEKSKHLLQAYMNLVMEDEKVSRSECLYNFLSPTPEFFLQPPPSSRKSKSFLTSFFKGNQNTCQEGSDEEEFLFWDDDSGPMKDDPIAEPLYSLISEIFDMRGVFKLLRRTLITFVQIAYGRTINRQLRETVSWIFSEGMIIYYIHLFRDAMWPNGILAKPSPPRSQEEKTQTRSKARIHFLNSIPEVLSNLVGQPSAKRGTLKVFESFQDERLNKQIFYELLELFLNEVFTENRLK